MESVAARAQVHKTTVYRRWETKERLVVEALEAAATQRMEVPDTGDAVADLGQLAYAIRNTLRSPEGAATVRALVAGGAESDAVRSVARRFWSTRMRELRGVVDRAVDRGDFPARTDADAVLMAVAAPLYLRLLVTAQPLTRASADLAAASTHAAASAGAYVRQR